MSMKRWRPEEIVQKPREAEVELVKGGTVTVVCTRIAHISGEVASSNGKQLAL